LASLALIEIGYLSPAFVAADRCLKSSGVRLIGVENADSGELCLKFAGDVSAAEDAGRIAEGVARTMGVGCRVSVLAGPDEGARRTASEPPQFGPLLGVYDGYAPREDGMSATGEAIGLLETQGLSVNLHALDVMLKTASVRVVGKEKIGGGYVTLMVRGDLAAVQAAVEAGRGLVERLGGRLILADVISNPHPELLALLPRGG
jgi:microcompartment protein CcmL/EutN